MKEAQRPTRLPGLITTSYSGKTLGPTDIIKQPPEVIVRINKIIPTISSTNRPDHHPILKVFIHLAAQPMGKMISQHPEIGHDLFRLGKHLVVKTLQNILPWPPPCKNDQEGIINMAVSQPFQSKDSPPLGKTISCLESFLL
jgi:hypothetical protein